LTVQFWVSQHDGNIRGIQKVEVSQRKLNCALFVKNSLIKNFPEARKSGGNLNLQDRTNPALLKADCVFWRSLCSSSGERLEDAVGFKKCWARMVRISSRVCGTTNFVLGGNCGGHKPPLLNPGLQIFTESLILAQNERWRRG
jgi:hypothetical protein